MQFYRQIFNNLDNSIQPKHRDSMLMKHIERHFPVLLERHRDLLSDYIDGSITYYQILPYLGRIKSERILQMDEGRVRSKNYILGLRDPVLDEVRRFQEAFGVRSTLGGDRVPGTGVIQNSTQHRVKTFLW